MLAICEGQRYTHCNAERSEGHLPYRVRCVRLHVCVLCMWTHHADTCMKTKRKIPVEVEERPSRKHIRQLRCRPAAAAAGTRPPPAQRAETQLRSGLYLSDRPGREANFDLWSTLPRQVSHAGSDATSDGDNAIWQPARSALLVPYAGLMSVSACEQPLHGIICALACGACIRGECLCICHTGFTHDAFNQLHHKHKATLEARIYKRITGPRGSWETRDQTNTVSQRFYASLSSSLAPRTAGIMSCLPY